MNRAVRSMYTLLRPLLFKIDPARAHALAMAALAPVEYIAPLRTATAAVFGSRDPRLVVRKMGLVFPSPIGVAAGLDKNAGRPRALAALGFGHVELGTVTAEAQTANPRPNMFRLPADRALVNRLGFPNDGAARVAARIAVRKSAVGVPVGVSIGKSRSVPTEPLEGVIGDYLASFRAVRDVADFVVVNVSSPNTADLRSLQVADTARPLLQALARESDRGTRVPILVKIAPDLSDAAIDAVCEEVRRAGLAGVVATNTTIGRDGLVTPKDTLDRIGAGGLSGTPLFPRALAVVKRVRGCLGKDACVIGVGGVDSVETALAMLRVGADLVQVYTGFVYQGPFLPRTIAKGLADVLTQEGADSLATLASGALPSQAHMNGGASSVNGTSAHA